MLFTTLTKIWTDMVKVKGILAAGQQSRKNANMETAEIINELNTVICPAVFEEFKITVTDNDIIISGTPRNGEDNPYKVVNSVYTSLNTIKGLMETKIQMQEPKKGDKTTIATSVSVESMKGVGQKGLQKKIEKYAEEQKEQLKAAQDIENGDLPQFERTNPMYKTIRKNFNVQVVNIKFRSKRK